MKLWTYQFVSPVMYRPFGVFLTSGSYHFAEKPKVLVMERIWDKLLSNSATVISSNIKNNVQILLLLNMLLNQTR